MTQHTRHTFSPEFKLECAELVFAQLCTVRAACEAMAVSKSSINDSVRQLRVERAGKSHPASPITSEKLCICELEERLRRIEEENLILKPPSRHSTAHRVRITANSICDVSQISKNLRRNIEW